MTIETLQILDEDSFSTLHKQVAEDPSSLLTASLKVEKFDILASKFDLNLVDSTYRIDTSAKLTLPKGKSWDVNADRENAEIIYAALPGLTPTQATNGTLWASLCFNQFQTYVNARWEFVTPKEPKNLEKASGNYLREHWFANSARGRWRDNGVARLWWMSFYANSFEGLPFKTVLDTICLDSDLLGSLLGRPWTANNRVVSKHLISELRSLYFQIDSPKFSRAAFRRTLIDLDLRAGKYLLAALDEDAIQKLVKEIFQSNHDRV
jgi:hypothetical protein